MALASGHRHPPAQRLSQRELASRLGVSQRDLSELETGKPKVLNDQFFAVMEKLGIELTFREATAVAEAQDVLLYGTVTEPA